jgi:hypothetical protein
VTTEVVSEPAADVAVSEVPAQEVTADVVIETPTEEAAAE